MVKVWWNNSDLFSICSNGDSRGIHFPCNFNEMQHVQDFSNKVLRSDF